MSSKHQQFKAAAKAAAKSTAQLVGVPVDRICKKLEDVVDLFDSTSLINDRLNRMADYIEDIQRMISKTSGNEYEEEMNQLKQSLGTLAQTLRDRSQSRGQPSAFIKANNVEDLLRGSSDRLTQYLSVFNAAIMARHAATQRTFLQRAVVQDTRIDMLESKFLGQMQGDHPVDPSDIIPYRKLLVLRTKGTVRDLSGVATRIEEGTYDNQLVVVKTFVDKPEVATRAWRSEIKRYKRYRHANTERMKGVSPPSEIRPYIIVFPEGADIRQYFQSRTNIADVYNFLDSLTNTCGDLFRMGCYQWDSISVYPGGRPVIRPTIEDSRNLDGALFGVYPSFEVLLGIETNKPGYERGLHRHL